MAPHKCSYVWCENTSNIKSMFRFPYNDRNRLKVWLTNCGNMTIAHLPPESLRSRYLCIDHFNQKYVCDKVGQRNRLKKMAIPEPYQAIYSSGSSSPESQHNLDINTPMKPLITYKKPVQCQTCKSNIDNSHNDTSKRKRTTDDNLPEAEEIIESVYKYLQAEYELLKRYIGELSSLSDVLKRTADACGVRESTVRHVVRKPRPQRDLDVAGVGSEPAGGQPICGDSDIERQDDSSIAEEEFNSTYYAVEPEDNDEQSDEDSEEPDECEVEAPNMDIDHDENNHLDPLKTEPVEIKTEFTDMNPYSITNEKSRCDIPDIEQDVIEVTGDEIEERVQCDEQVVVKPEFTDVLYSQSGSSVTLLTLHDLVKTEPDDDDPLMPQSSVLCTSDVICDTTSYDVKCDPPGP